MLRLDMKDVEMLDISGDAGIKVYGKTLPELFVNAAAGMYSLIVDPAALNEVAKVEVSANGNSLEGALVSWLNELIFRFDAYGFIGKHIIPGDFTHEESAEDAVAVSFSATVSGEQYDPERHEGKMLLKAATYHRLKIEQNNGIWEAEIIFDI